MRRTNVSLHSEEVGFIMMKYTEGSIAFLVCNNLFVKRVIVAKATSDFYTVSFYDDLNVHGAIRVRHNRLYASQKEAEAAIEERRARMPKKPQAIPDVPVRHSTHWEFMM